MDSFESSGNREAGLSLIQVMVVGALLAILVLFISDWSRYAMQVTRFPKLSSGRDFALRRLTLAVRDPRAYLNSGFSWTTCPNSPGGCVHDTPVGLALNDADNQAIAGPSGGTPVRYAVSGEPCVAALAGNIDQCPIEIYSDYVVSCPVNPVTGASYPNCNGSSLATDPLPTMITVRWYVKQAQGSAPEGVMGRLGTEGGYTSSFSVLGGGFQPVSPP